MIKFTEYKKDMVLIIILLLLGIVAGLFLFVQKPEGGMVCVTVDGREYGTYPLDADNIIEISGEDMQGVNTLVISGNSAYMQSASCPDHLCVKMGHIKREGQSVICLPNKVVVTIISNDDSLRLDSVVQ